MYTVNMNKINCDILYMYVCSQMRILGRARARAHTHTHTHTHPHTHTLTAMYPINRLSGNTNMRTKVRLHSRSQGVRSNTTSPMKNTICTRGRKVL